MIQKSEFVKITSKSNFKYFKKLIASNIQLIKLCKSKLIIKFQSS